MKLIIIFNLIIAINSFLIPNENYLLDTIKQLNHKKKGILAADESLKTIGKRFLDINVKNNKQNRKNYRELLFTTPDLEKYVSGCILYEESLYQKINNYENCIDYLKKKKILPGIKLDMGLKKISNKEYITLGLDSLEEKCKKYNKEGIRFAKWRSVFQINKNKCSDSTILDNCHSLAKYAKICQENNIVPIIEPEIVMDGNHNIYTTAKNQEKILKNLFKILDEYNIFIEGLILKTNMVVPGKDCIQKSYPNEIANLTIRTLERSVPCSVPIIVFLSGGLSEKESSLNLNAIKKQKKKGKWNLNFSFGRALQDSCLKTWKGKRKNKYESQKILLKRLISNTNALQGKYNNILENLKKK